MHTLGPKCYPKRAILLAYRDNDQIHKEFIQWPESPDLEPNIVSQGQTPPKSKMLFLSKDGLGCRLDLSVRLRQIAKREWFQVIPSDFNSDSEVAFCEDYCIVCPDQSVLAPYSIGGEESKIAVNDSRKMRASKLRLPWTPACIGSHSIEAQKLEDGVRKIKPYLGDKWRQSRLCIEGGNLLIGNFECGEHFTLVGIDDRVRSVIALQEQGIAQAFEEVLGEELNIRRTNIFVIE